MSDNRRFILGVYLLGAFLGSLIGCAVGPRVFPTPQPTPRETPWLWIDTAPEGGACYVFGDKLGPCFTKPSPEATP